MRKSKTFNNLELKMYSEKRTIIFLFANDSRALHQQ